MKMEEIWKPVPGYELFSEISSAGRVRRLATSYEGLFRHVYIDEKILKNVKDTHYYCVTFSIRGKNQKKFIHRLVAEAFIPNPENKPQVNHKDLNKFNNDLSNLEWVTVSENAAHAYGMGVSPHIGESRKLPIIAIEIKTGEETEFSSQTDAARELKIYASNINKILKGIGQTAKGYTFKYKQSILNLKKH